MASLLNSNTSDDYFGNQALANQAKIQKLCKAAVECFDRDDITVALAKFKKAYLLSCSVPEKHMQKVCLFNLGAAYISNEKPKKGLKCLIKSVTKGNAKRDGDLFFNIGIAYDALKDHAKAGKFYAKAINEYEQGEISNISDALIKLGYTFVETGNLDSAAQAFKLAGSSYQKAQKNVDAAMAFREAANYMIRSQEFSITEVLQALNGSVELCKGITDNRLLVKLYNHLAIHYTEIKFLAEAYSCLKESMRCCSGVNFSNQKMAVLLQNSAAVENAMGRYETSVASHMEAADMFGILGDRNAQGQCLCNLAYAYSQQQHYDRAEFYYQQALHAFVDAGVLQGQWQASEGMGASQFCQGNTDEAIASYKQALALFVKSKDMCERNRERLLRRLTEAIEYKATHAHLGPNEASCSFTNKNFSSNAGYEGNIEIPKTRPQHSLDSDEPGNEERDKEPSNGNPDITTELITSTPNVSGRREPEIPRLNNERSPSSTLTPTDSSRTSSPSTITHGSTTSRNDDGAPNSSDSDESDKEGQPETHEAEKPGYLVRSPKKIKSRMCSIF
ncbi:tetratricopeptide repeat protein 24-like isoform X2 [Lissotriton helveticus]